MIGSKQVHSHNARPSFLRMLQQGDRISLDGLRADIDAIHDGLALAGPKLDLAFALPACTPHPFTAISSRKRAAWTSTIARHGCSIP